MSAHRTYHDLHRGGGAKVNLLKDPGDGGTIRVDRTNGVLLLTSGASTETRTLPRPTFAGDMLQIIHRVDGGGQINVTVTGGFNAAGHTTISFQDAGDSVLLRSVEAGAGTFRWQIIRGFGATGTGVTGAALTAASNNINFSASGEDLDIQGVTSSTPFGFVSANEGNTVIRTVENSQERINDIELRLQQLELIL